VEKRASVISRATVQAPIGVLSSYVIYLCSVFFTLHHISFFKIDVKKAPLIPC